MSEFPLQIPPPTRAGPGAGPRPPSVATLPPEPLTLRVLGRFTARRPGHEIDPCPLATRDGARLVRFLLVHRERAVSELEILGELWPETLYSMSSCSLRQALADARRMLDAPGRAGSALCTADGSYRLCLGWHDRVDADDFEAIASMALRTHGPNRRAQLELALSQWTGEPMPEERHSRWATAWRDRLCARHDELLRALDELSAPEQARGVPRQDSPAEPPRAAATAS